MNRKLDDIEKKHSRDGDVLFALGAFFDNDRQQDRAAPLFNRAIDIGCEEPEAYLKRARVRVDDDAKGATEDALHALRTERLPPPLVREAVRLVSDERVGDVAESAAVMSLGVDGRVWLAKVLAESLKGEVEPTPFARVVELHSSNAESDDANYQQCMAVANWAVGDEAMGLESVEHARRALEAERGTEFSCWRYCRVPVKEFQRDLDEIAALLRGDASGKPRFMTVAAARGPSE